MSIVSKQNKYSKKVIVIAGFLYFVEIVFLVCLFVYLSKNKATNILGESTMRINKENIVFHKEGELEYFYEWDANQEIIHRRSWLPRDIVAVTNADGLIGGTDYLIDKPEGVFRIIAIGDSFTEGPFVEAEFTYPKLLERMLNSTSFCSDVDHYEVLNLGVGGYDIEYSAYRLETRGLKYKPDLIIWLLKDDDFIERTEVDVEKSMQYARHIMDNLGGDIEKFDSYHRYASGIDDGESDLMGKIHNMLAIQQKEEKAHIEYFPFQEKAIARISTLTTAPIVMMTFKDTNKMFKMRMKLWSMQYKNLLLYENISRLEQGIDTFAPHDGHPNRKGYKIIAEDILGELKKTKLTCLK